MTLLAGICVFAGAGLGGLCRRLVGEGLARWTALPPLGTLLVNLFGCFLIGIVAGWLEWRTDLPREIRLLLITGFLGGFTTFSAFALETVSLFSQRSGWALAALLVKPALCVGLAWLGLTVMRRA